MLPMPRKSMRAFGAEIGALVDARREALADSALCQMSHLEDHRRRISRPSFVSTPENEVIGIDADGVVPRVDRHESQPSHMSVWYPSKIDDMGPGYAKLLAERRRQRLQHL